MSADIRRAAVSYVIFSKETSPSPDLLLVAPMKSVPYLFYKKEPAAIADLKVAMAFFVIYYYFSATQYHFFNFYFSNYKNSTGGCGGFLISTGRKDTTTVHPPVYNFYRRDAGYTSTASIIHKSSRPEYNFAGMEVKSSTGRKKTEMPAFNFGDGGHIIASTGRQMYPDHPLKIFMRGGRGINSTGSKVSAAHPLLCGNGQRIFQQLSNFYGADTEKNQPLRGALDLSAPTLLFNYVKNKKRGDLIL